MAITGVQSVVYGVEDLEKSIRFHRDFGLDAVSENGAAADFELADGSTILVRRKDDPSLPDDALSKPAVRELIWWVDSEEALDKLERNLAIDREARRGRRPAYRRSLWNRDRLSGFRAAVRRVRTGVGQYARPISGAGTRIGNGAARQVRNSSITWAAR